MKASSIRGSGTRDSGAAPPARLPQLELECMRVLWEMPGEAGASVAQVRAALDRPLAYTTVLTLLDRMAAKGVVTRRKAGRAFVYSPVLDLEAARREALRNLLVNLFGNDKQALLRHVERLGGGATTARKIPPAAPPRARAGRASAGSQFRPAHIDDSLL